ncbi:hypothetical protein D9M69_647870 [compost metagenome]
MRARARGAVLADAVEQLGHDALDAFERVADGARLLEDFLLHVVAVGAELGCAAVRVHGFHRALGGVKTAALPVGHPVAAELQVDQIALFEVDDLVGHAGQGHGVAGQEVLLPALAHTEDQR